jgi:hypothetical protein
MNVRSLSMTRATIMACGIALLSIAGASLAAEPEPMDRPPPSKEMRAKMASAHEQLAACLRSDRPIDECHDEMMKQHEMMHHGHDVHEGMAKGDKPAEKPADKPTQK